MKLTLTSISFKNLTFKTIASLAVLAMFSACTPTKGKIGTDGNGAFGTGPDGAFSDQDLALAERQWGQGNIPEAQSGGQFGSSTTGGPFQDINFGYDSSEIPREFISQLESDARVLAEDSSLKVEIEGHCDSRGTSEYNLALGKARAKSVAKYLVNLGVKPSQLSTITYGEEIPLETSESESAFRANRRAHFAIFRDRASFGGESGQIDGAQSQNYQPRGGEPYKTHDNY